MGSITPPGRVHAVLDAALRGVDIKSKSRLDRVRSSHDIFQRP